VGIEYKGFGNLHLVRILSGYLLAMGRFSIGYLLGRLPTVIYFLIRIVPSELNVIGFLIRDKYIGYYLNLIGFLFVLKNGIPDTFGFPFIKLE
jgi:hypothetical protein